MNQKKVFLIHGWEGHPENHWFPWLRRELETKGFEVIVPQMSGGKYPVLDARLSELKQLVGVPDEQTYFVGHSLGCVTILKYLAGLPDKTRVGGALLVAGFMTTLGIAEIEGFTAIPVDTVRVRAVCPRIVAFQSINDDYVPLAHGEALRDELGAELVVIDGAGHFTDDNYETFPILLETLLRAVT